MEEKEIDHKVYGVEDIEIAEGIEDILGGVEDIEITVKREEGSISVTETISLRELIEREKRRKSV